MTDLVVFLEKGLIHAQFLLAHIRWILHNGIKACAFALWGPILLKEDLREFQFGFFDMMCTTSTEK
jgi:hypothetical protein